MGALYSCQEIELERERERERERENNKKVRLQAEECQCLSVAMTVQVHNMYTNTTTGSQREITQQLFQSTQDAY